MRGGTLRHRVQVLAPPTGKNEFGELVVARMAQWNPVMALWGRVSPTSGGEESAVQKVSAEVTHEIRLRLPITLPGGGTLTPQHGLRHRERNFSITAVLDDDERRREAIVLCREVA